MHINLKKMAESIEAVKSRFGIVGQNNDLNEAIRAAVTVAPTSASVLILGESGVGKENIAKIIHEYSSRKHNQFISLNCGSIPEGTIDSELFGHEKGAFTGATEERKGYFEMADKGTIFLDEIGNLPLSAQERLLRVLDYGEYIRVGSSKVRKTDVRVVAATNANLSEQVSNGRFRMDLYYRLTTVLINVPALRDRKEDLPFLFARFAADMANAGKIPEPIQLTDDALKFMQNYNWPGNIRQLKHVVESMSYMEKDRLITADTFSKYVANAPSVKYMPSLLSVGGDQSASYNHNVLLSVIYELKKEVDALKKEVADLKLNEQVRRSGIYRDINNQIIEQTSVGDSKVPKQVLTYQPVKSYVEPIDTPAESVDEDNSVESTEKQLFQRILAKHNGNRRAAAAELKISERTLYRKIEKYGL